MRAAKFMGPELGPLFTRLFEVRSLVVSNLEVNSMMEKGKQNAVSGFLKDLTRAGKWHVQGPGFNPQYHHMHLAPKKSLLTLRILKVKKSFERRNLSYLITI
jgi:hypothetical protein